MDILREQIYLAGLLHDIGKFFQRADTGSVESSTLLPEEARHLVSQFCPVYQGKYSHKHVIWTAGFISKYSQIFNSLLKNQRYEEARLIEMAAGHHLSVEQLKNTPSRFIREADHLSSGMDRSNSEAYKDEQVAQNWDAFKKIRMVSIFEGLGREAVHSHEYHLPVVPLNLTNEWFPSLNHQGIPDYAALWQEFESEFKFIQADEFRSFSETFLNLLQKFTSSIPASTVNFPDVSLFDHLKTTASIAVCLYDKSQEPSGNEKEDEFLMIGGDFSGIQSYIYNILSKQAARNLKGRSLYIKLLSDAVVFYLLKELNLFEANVIYNAGGSFYILAPNTALIREKYVNCKMAIEDKIFEAHGTSIFVSLDYVTISKDTFLSRGKRNLSDAWQQLFDKRNAGKKHKYSKRLLNSYNIFFRPFDNGGEAVRDAITGEELTGMSVKALNENEYVSDLTWKQIVLGKKLRDAELLVISQEPLSYWKDRDFIEPAHLGFYFYFLSKKEVENKKENLRGSADRVKIITINGNSRGECDFLNSALQGYNNIFGFDYMGGNDFPKDEEGHPLTFDKLAGSSQFKRLGVLRMDVDNLGMIFRNGLPKEMLTLSRYSSLSRNLDWFFKGYINTIWENNFRENTIIIYSGGDDLFLVGRWDKVLQFGNKIREEFNKYVCFNPVFSLSGGLAIVPGKYPIKKASADSELMEKAAKSYFYEVEKKGQKIRFEKSAITLLGMPLNWDHEFKVVNEIRDKILPLIISEKKSLPKSFISKIGAHHAMAQNVLVNVGSNKSEIPPKVKWMMAYDFGRMLERIKDKDAQVLIRQCQQDIFSNTINNAKINSKYHSLELWNLAARLAELQTRTNEF